jgi:hypothetical protein
MRYPRITLGTAASAVLVCALDFAIIRASLFSPSNPRAAILGILSLPMLDLLLVAGYRLRTRERRTPRAVGFLASGLLATALVFAVTLLAWDAVMGTFVRLYEPIMRRMDCAPSAVVQLALDFTFQLFIPIAFFCTLPLVASLLGGWMTHRIMARRSPGSAAEAA